MCQTISLYQRWWMGQRSYFIKVNLHKNILCDPVTSFTTVWSSSPLTFVCSANFQLWFIPHSAGLYRQGVQQSDSRLKRFQSAFKAFVLFGFQSDRNVDALWLVFMALDPFQAVVLFMLFNIKTKTPVQMGAFGLSQFRAAGMLASVGEEDGEFVLHHE